MLEIDVRTLRDHIGRELAISGWLEVSQARIDQFADATGDHQWIHVDAARAAAESPFKTTIAHGFLTLSLVGSLLRDAIKPTGLQMSINYGLNRVRFVSPVPSGSRIRGRFTVAGVEEAGGSIQTAWQATIEREGGDKPACVADWLVRYYL
jgi:acyl dehydratase